MIVIVVVLDMHTTTLRSALEECWVGRKKIKQKKAARNEQPLNDVYKEKFITKPVILPTGLGPW